MVKISKKTQHLLDYLDEIQEELQYFSNKKNYKKEKIDILKNYIEETSLDRKIDHARFAKWLKWVWNNRKD
jgi:hypothetical protein